MNDNTGFCPCCGIGLNSDEQRLKFCQNCKEHWNNDDDVEPQYYIWVCTGCKKEFDETPAYQKCNNCASMVSIKYVEQLEEKKGGGDGK